MDVVSRYFGPSNFRGLAYCNSIVSVSSLLIRSYAQLGPKARPRQHNDQAVKPDSTTPGSKSDVLKYQGLFLPLSLFLSLCICTYIYICIYVEVHIYTHVPTEYPCLCRSAHCLKAIPNLESSPTFGKQLRRSRICARTVRTA